MKMLLAQQQQVDYYYDDETTTLSSSFPSDESFKDDTMKDDDEDYPSLSPSNSNGGCSPPKSLLRNGFLMFTVTLVVAVVVVATPSSSAVLWSNDGDQGLSHLPTTTNQQQRQLQRQKKQTVKKALTCPVRFNRTAEEMLMQISQLRKREQIRLCQKDVSKDQCHCHFPTRGRPPTVGDRDAATMEWFGPKWDATTARNHESASQPPPNGQYDVVFLGDSITEHFQGTDLLHVGPNWIKTKEVFDSYFNQSMGGPYNGLALGIGGDMAPQIQYRIDHEIPETLDAKVFWILVGTNDAGYARCNAEAVAAGNIQIVENLLKRWPNSKVVLNSFLPRGKPGTPLFHHDFDDPLWENYATVTNQWLECYAASRTDNRVDFFNATDYFLDYGDIKEEEAGDTTNATITQTDYPILVAEYYADGVHPSGKGCNKWLKGVVSHLQNNLGIEAQ